MKKLLFTLIFLSYLIQGLFAWAGAMRDISKQPFEVPVIYVGDIATFAWKVSNGPTLIRIGVAILPEAPATFSALTWNIPINYTVTSYQGKMLDFVATSPGTGYYSLWAGWGAVVGTNGSFFNGKNTTMTYGNTNNSDGGSNVPWNVTYCYGTFTVNALNNPENQTAVAASASSINLLWNKDLENHNVMIVRKKSTDPITNPTQGTAYSVSDPLGSGTVIYNGDGTEFTDSDLLSNTEYDYIYYSVNNGYYSSGVTTTETTLSGGTTLVNQNKEYSLIISKTDDKISIKNIQNKHQFILYELTGSKVYCIENEDSSCEIFLPKTQMYILQYINTENNTRNVIKIF